MAQVIWKNIIWRGSTRETSIKELLTILKGYGPMEVVHFEKPGKYKGELNLWLDEDGVRHITLFHLEVIGEKCKGVGRQAFKHLRKIFGCDAYVQHPGQTISSKGKNGGIHVEQPSQASAIFWIKMFEENLIQSVDGDFMCLDENTSADELETLKKKILN